MYCWLLTLALAQFEPNQHDLIHTKIFRQKKISCFPTAKPSCQSGLTFPQEYCLDQQVIVLTNRDSRLEQSCLFVLALLQQALLVCENYAVNTASYRKTHILKKLSYKNIIDFFGRIPTVPTDFFQELLSQTSYKYL